MIYVISRLNFANKNCSYLVKKYGGEKISFASP